MDDGTRDERMACRTLHHVKLMQDEAFTIDGVISLAARCGRIFNDADSDAMRAAWRGMSDYRLIYSPQRVPLEPVDTIKFHEQFVQKLIKWFEADLSGKRCHQPSRAGLEPKNAIWEQSDNACIQFSGYGGIIKQYQPILWVYGHTHECDDQTVGKTRIISNQLGYPDHSGGYECVGFDPAGEC